MVSSTGARRFMVLAMIAVVAMLVGAFVAPVHAEEGACQRANASWLAQCSERTGVSMRAELCPAGKILLRVGGEAHPLRVEVSRDQRRSFRQVGEFGVSPVGEFEDWSLEPKERQEALEAVITCLGESPVLGDGKASPIGRHSRVPWLFLGAILGAMACGLAGPVRRWRRDSIIPRKLLREAWIGRGLGGWLAFALVVLFCLAGRWVLSPMDFFHQNGQGPFWIEIALQGGASSKYGPGYGEIFSWIANLHATAPDRLVVFFMACLGAMTPVAGWILARSSGASVVTSWIIAALLCIHPLLARLAASESYFAVQFALLIGAAAVLSWAGRYSRTWSRAFFLGVLTAGLLLAQAARIHPTAWLPAATLPLVLLAQPGRIPTLIQKAAIACIGVGGVVAATSGIALWDVYTGPLGQHWPAASQFSFPHPSTSFWAAIVGCGVLLVVARDRVRLGLALAAGGATVIVVLSADLLGGKAPWIADAYRIQFLPVILAACLTSLQLATSRWPRLAHPLIIGTVAVVGMSLIAAGWQGHRTLPTDTLEQRWALQWRKELPKDSYLVYLSRAEDRILMLPLYDGGPVRFNAVNSQQLAAQLASTGAGSFYYRSSLCRTPQGEAACEFLERSVKLQVVEERDLPAVASLLPLEEGSIRVGLYRVVGSNGSAF